MHTVQTWLSGVPPVWTYVLVAAIVGVESLGVPLPGEIVLVAAALLASSGYAEIQWVVVAGCVGAIGGDSIGYAIGHYGGKPFLDWLGRKFPHHMGPAQIAKAEVTFQKYGAWAIFFGRFVALLRILAGPLSGALKVRYPVFLAANAAGGICWAGGTALIVYYVGRVAEKWLSDFSWVALAVAVVAGAATTLFIRHKTRAKTGAKPGDPAEAAEAGAEDPRDDHAAAGER